MLVAFRVSQTHCRGGIKEISLMPKVPISVLWLSKGCSGINICPLNNKEPPDFNHLQPVQDINW